MLLRHPWTFEACKLGSWKSCSHSLLSAYTLLLYKTASVLRILELASASYMPLANRRSLHQKTRL